MRILLIGVGLFLITGDSLAQEAAGVILVWIGAWPWVVNNLENEDE